MNLFLNEFTEELILSSGFNLKKPEEKKMEMPFLQPVQIFPSQMKIQPNLQLRSSFPRISDRKLTVVRPKMELTRKMIRPPAVNVPEGVDKIDFLLRDPRVTAVECPGPGKFLIIRKGFRVLMTKEKLNEEQIKQKIQEFSEKSRIPLIGGIFKANVGNLTISAVLSDYAGSRFIITKFISPGVPPLNQNIP